MDGEQFLNSLGSDEHIDAMLMVQMETHEDHNSGFSSAIGLFSNNDHSSGIRDCNKNNRDKMISQFNDPWQPRNSNMNEQHHFLSNSGYNESKKVATFTGEKDSSMEAMREMIFRIAAMQPIVIDKDSVKPAKRKNVKISKDPQSVAARHRRERISERIRILQKLVPGGTKMDTASMLDEAVHYMNFLKNQVQSLEKDQGKSY